MDNSIILDFIGESKQILSELEEIVLELERATTSKGNDFLVQFAQRIDRVMGAAQTLGVMYPANIGLKEIGKIAALCKAMGYKVSEIDAPELLPLFCAFWSDTIEVLSEIIDHLENAEEVSKIAGNFVPVVRKRLEWLSSKIKTVSPKETTANQDLNELLNALFK